MWEIMCWHGKIAYAKKAVSELAVLQIIGMVN